MNKTLYVGAEHKRYQTDAENLAKHLNVQVMEDGKELEKGALLLSFGKDGMALTDGKLSMIADFHSMIPRVKDTMWKHELLVKAARFKSQEGGGKAIDATAGLGEDSLLLAAAGFEVILFEHDPVIAALLKDALRRARKIPELKEMIGRMQVMEGDSIEAMNKWIDPLDVIYLDPMFPERQKSSLIKKKFQLLQQLERPCSEEQDLLNAAINANPKRIIIKRPAKGPYIADVKPAYSIQGKSIRYDCIAL